MGKPQSTTTPLLVGIVSAGLARAALRRLLLVKLNRDVRALNNGDYRSLLSSYSRDAVLVFHEGGHRWSGEHRGREAIETFFREFVAARIQGEIRELFMQGWPWRMTLVARFDDFVDGPGGERLYENQTMLVVQMRWGRIVRHEDFYADTGRITLLEQRLRELGMHPVAVPPG
jgi:ketosteroid isomerase-like protein